MENKGKAGKTKRPKKGKSKVASSHLRRALVADVTSDVRDRVCGLCD